MVAALIFLHPKLAARALLEFLAGHKLHEIVIGFAVGIGDLVFLAGHAFVPVRPAVEAVILLTLRALESRVVIFFEKKHILTVSRGAP